MKIVIWTKYSINLVPIRLDIRLYLVPKVVVLDRVTTMMESGDSTDDKDVPWTYLLYLFCYMEHDNFISLANIWNLFMPSYEAHFYMIKTIESGQSPPTLESEFRRISYSATTHSKVMRYVLFCFSPNSFSKHLCVFNVKCVI